MADDAVVTTFTADTSQLDAALQEILDRIGALEGAANSGSESLGKLGASSTESAGGLKETESAAAGLLERLEALGGAAGAAGGVLSALGLEGEAGAAGIESLSGAMKGLMAAAPELLAIGAAIAAVGAAFAFIKDGIGEASEFQAQMETLGAAVENQGGKWGELKDKVEEWANTESLASGIAKNEVVGALNQLVTAGMNVADAQKMVGVAEDIAIAKHMSLSEVTQQLQQAEAGRATTLVKLDANLKPLIASHATLGQILQQLHKDTQNQTDADESNERAWQRVHVIISEVGEKIGDFFLPIIRDLGITILGTIGEIEQFGKSVSIGFGDGVKAAQELGHAIADVAGIIADLVEHKWGDIAGKWSDLQRAGTSAWNDITASVQNYGNAISVVSGSAYDYGNKMAKDAIAAHDANLNNFTGGLFDQHTGMGHGSKGGHHGAHHKGAHHKGAHASAGEFDFQDASSVLDSATAATKSLHDANAQLDAQLKQTAKSVDGYHQQIALLTPVIKNENAEVYNGQQHLTALAGAAQQATDNYNAYGASLGKHPTKEEVAELKHLKTEMDAANKNYTDAKTRLDALTASLKHHKDELAAAQQGVQSFSDAWAAFTKSEQTSMTQDLQLFGKTNAEKAQLYQQWADAVIVVDQKTEAQREALQKQANSYYLQSLHDQVTATQQAQQQMQGYVTTFLDDILSKHMSFKDAFKNVWADIVKIFIADIEKMIVESQLFKSIFGNLGVGGGSFNPLGFLGIGGSSSSVAAANTLVGTPGTTAANALHVNIAGISPNATLGGSAAPTGGLGSIMPMLALGAGIFGMGDSIGNLISGGGPGNTHGIWGGVGALAGGVGALGVMGLAAGGGFGGLMSAAGLAALGPAGWGILLGGALLGGVAGGLFGHKDNPANMPDKYDTQNFGTIVADLQGSMGANGQQFTEQSSLSKASGGKTGIAWVEETLAKYANKDGSMGANTPDWLKPMWSQLVGAFGISATGSGQLNFGHAINNEWITGAQGVTANGNNPMQYTQLGNLLNSFYTAQQQSASNPNSNIPIFSLHRMAPDFNQGTFVAWSASTGTGSGAGGGTTGIHTEPIAVRPPDIHIHLDNGTVVGAGGMNELADKIEQMLARNRVYNWNNRYTTDY